MEQFAGLQDILAEDVKTGLARELYQQNIITERQYGLLMESLRKHQTAP